MMPHGVTGAEHPEMCKQKEEQVDTRVLYIENFISSSQESYCCFADERRKVV